MEQKLDEILRRIDKMTAQIGDLDAAIAAEEALENTLLGAVSTLITDYQAVVAKAQSGVDVTTELNEVNADAAKLQAAITSVTTADSNA
jgi:hypothetical protein